MQEKFYKCNRCGQIVRKVKDTKMPLICCGEEMSEIIPKEDEEGLSEKHVPIFKKKKHSVYIRVGETFHPSLYEHYIEWIMLITNKGSHFKCLKPGDYPEAYFNLDDDEVVESIYSYCNLHSLWVNKLNKNKCCR